MAGMRTRMSQATKMKKVPGTNNLVCHCGKEAKCWPNPYHSEGNFIVWWECPKGHRYQEILYTGNHVMEILE